MLLPPMVCSAWLLVVGGQVQGSRVCVQEEGCCTNASCNIDIDIDMCIASGNAHIDKHSGTIPVILARH